MEFLISLCVISKVDFLKLFQKVGEKSLHIELSFTPHFVNWRFFDMYVTPSKNNLFRKVGTPSWKRLHENRGTRSFSQLWDERVSSLSKRGPSYTGPAKPPNLPENWQIWWFGRTCIARPSLRRWRKTLISELTERFYAPVFMEAFSCGCSNFSK